MKTIALRFGETFSPEGGTIKAHQEVIDGYGYVWYGKLGSPISLAVAKEMLQQDDPRFLLIHSGGSERYWMHVSAIERDISDLEHVPSYYRNQAKDFGCWFKVTSIERAESSVMSKCVVRSSGKPLTAASRHSMSPYFIIDYVGDAHEAD